MVSQTFVSALQNTPSQSQAQGAPAADLPADFRPPIASIALDPTNRVPWNTLDLLALGNKLYVWEFRLSPLAHGTIKDGKSAVVANHALLEHDYPKPLVDAWVKYALSQIVVQEPEARKKNDVDAIDLPFRDDYFPLEALAKSWQTAGEADGSLHDSQLDALALIYQAKLLPAYVYLTYFDENRKEQYSRWGQQHQADIYEYFRRFVLIPQNAVPDYAKADIERDNDKNRPETMSHQAEKKLSEEEKDELRKEILSLSKRMDSMEKNPSLNWMRGQLALSIGKDLLELEKYDLAVVELQGALALLSPATDIYRVAEANLYLGLTREEMKQFDLAVPSLLKAAQIFESLAEAERQSVALGQLARSEARLDRFGDAAGHARETLELAKSDPSLRASAMSTAFHVYLIMFDSIDWNSISGRERDASDEDFVNNGDVGKPGEKYGRRSSDEDSATFQTFYNTQCQQPPPLQQGQDCLLTRHVRSQIRAGDFAPAVKYLYFKFVQVYYQPETATGEDLVFQGVVVHGGMRTMELALCDAYNGDDRAFVELYRSVGLAEDSDVAGVKPGKNGHQTDHDLTFAEVNQALAASLAAGKYIPDHVQQVLAQFEQACKYATDHQMKPFCERERLAQK